MLLSANRIVKSFRTGRGTVHAVGGVGIEIVAGETVGLVGESGCGKSTLGKLLVRLIEPDSGSIWLDGTDITTISRRQLRPLRRTIQMIFQDPYASLNPRSTAGAIIEEPLTVHGVGTKAAHRERVLWLAERVGLRRDALGRYPHEFSGGQRQRIGIARALALNPKLIICDEPVSALDVSVQAQVLNLLAELQQELGLSFLFISHDLSVVEHVSDRVLVMYLGKIVESGETDALWQLPLHPYTQALIGSLPAADPDATARPRPALIEGDVPSPLSPPSGCRFHTRCPSATDECRVLEPVLRPVGDGRRAVACHWVSADASAELRPI
ncbi:MAG: ATP-binding cassette domain-containing protein [Hyphomicrobiales bacterium]|nr:ATP-binding cassette domain-containing protein [Hyphomicrobiales bacterium]